MPNNKSAEKRVKVAATKRRYNVSARSALRTSVKRFVTSLEGDKENAKAILQRTIKDLDKAAAKGIIHKNAAARRKSRLTKKLSNMA